MIGNLHDASVPLVSVCTVEIIGVLAMIHAFSLSSCDFFLFGSVQKSNRKFALENIVQYPCGGKPLIAKSMMTSDGLQCWGGIGMAVNIKTALGRESRIDVNHQAAVMNGFRYSFRQACIPLLPSA